MEVAKRANEIFVLSDSFIRIKELIDDERSTIDDIADVILLDPALSATVLKLANSSFFNYPGKIDTISKAVLVLGITEVYNLVIAYFTTDAFKSIDAEVDFLEDFWERSVDCALLVKYIGCTLKIPNAERLFILGLLHNIGELVVKQFMPEKVALCYGDNLDMLPWQKQQEVLGFTFAECTAELLKLWQLPFTLIDPIRNQDQDDFSQVSKESALLCFAKRVMISNSVYPKLGLEPLVSAEQRTQLAVENDTIASAVSYCNLERLGVLAMLSPSTVTIY